MKLSLDQEMGLAARLQRDGNLPAAESLYRKILKSNPKLSTAHYNLALILKQVGKTAAADKSFKLAVKADANYTLAWQGYARFLSDRERHRNAVHAALQAAKLSNGSPSSSQLVADLLQAADKAPLGRVAEDALAYVLQRSDVDADITIEPALTHLRADPVLKGPLNDPSADLGGTDLSKLISALNNQVTGLIFSNLILPIAAGENLIRQVRDAFLAIKIEAAPTGDVAASTDHNALLEAMAITALQLELGEFCLPSPNTSAAPDSDASLEALVHATLRGARSISAYEDAIKAEETRLQTLPFTRLLLNRLGPDRRRIEELKADFQPDQPPADPVSERVRDQYEQSPYPRWQGVRHGQQKTLPELVQSLFPLVTVKRLSETPRVLVAGSGTGRHALRTALRLKSAEVTAIDLSAASLAYAEMKRQALNISNIRFQPGDITRLPEDLGQFDLIECCGVLHHMADPEGGWRSLLGHLKADGVMKVALYSQIARQDVIAARTYLNLAPETASLDQIRAARTALQALPEDHPAKPVTRELDFYSLSGCRDFLFHRQEQCFTIPRIAQALEDLKLEFLGFEFVSTAAMEAYQRAFPGDPFGRHLENWEKAEATTPHLFRAMYQFWCCRA